MIVAPEIISSDKRPDRDLRVLHVTDCHVVASEGGEVYGTDTYRSLQAVLLAASALPESPQFILATGDLSEDGSAGSYRRLRELFLATELPVYVIAGNHDSLNTMQDSLLGGVIRMVRCLDAGSWRIVFLDSKVAGEPHGYLEDSELKFFVHALTEDSQRPVLACLHHSPTRPCPSTGCRLDNDDAFVQLLDAHANVRAVLAGHIHLESERRARHAMLLTTPASSSQCRHAQLGEDVDHEDFLASHELDPTRHGFRMLSLHPDGGFDTELHWVHDGAR